jgi:hypothetical protein
MRSGPLLPCREPTSPKGASVRCGASPPTVATWTSTNSHTSEESLACRTWRVLPRQEELNEVTADEWRAPNHICLDHRDLNGASPRKLLRSVSDLSADVIRSSIGSIGIAQERIENHCE